MTITCLVWHHCLPITHVLSSCAGKVRLPIYARIFAYACIERCPTITDDLILNIYMFPTISYSSPCGVSQQCSITAKVVHLGQRQYFCVCYFFTHSPFSKHMTDHIYPACDKNFKQGFKSYHKCTSCDKRFHIRCLKHPWHWNFILFGCASCSKLRSLFTTGNSTPSSNFKQTYLFWSLSVQLLLQMLLLSRQLLAGWALANILQRLVYPHLLHLLNQRNLFTQHLVVLLYPRLGAILGCQSGLLQGL